MEIKWIMIALISYFLVGLGAEALAMYERLEKEKLEVYKQDCGGQPIDLNLDQNETIK